jgi:trehalose-6-phosphate synthase
MSPAERAQRSQAINQIVATSDVARWIRHQLEDIRSLTPSLRGLSTSLKTQPNGPPNRLRTKRRA